MEIKNLIGETTEYDKKQLVEVKRPSFRSDRYQFTVILPNLNYGTQDGTQKFMEIQITELIRNNQKITTEKIADYLGISTRTVKRYIKKMNHIKFVGRGSNGHWEILK